jgi:hypothetical protein
MQWQIFHIYRVRFCFIDPLVSRLMYVGWQCGQRNLFLVDNTNYLTILFEKLKMDVKIKEFR